MTPTTVPTSQSRFLSDPELRRPVLAALLAFFAVLILGGLRVDNGFVSPFDEGYHLSYVQYASEGHIPRVGDPMARWAEDAYSCYKVPPFGEVTVVECGVDGPSELYPEAGTNTAAIWPPTYYLLAGAWTKAGVGLFGAEPLLAARWFSVVIWGAGAALLAAMAARHSRNLALGASIGILCGTAPVNYAQLSYVTPHSAALLVGTVTMGYGLWAMRSTLGLPVRAAAGVAVGALAVMTIPQGLAAVLVVAAALPAWSLISGGRFWSNTVVAGALAGTAGLLGIAWSLVVAARELPTETAGQPTTPQETIPQAILSGWQLFFPPGGGAEQFHTSREAMFIAILGYLIVGAVGYQLLSRRLIHQRALAIGLVLAVPLVGAAFTYLLNFPVPARYGATIIPIYWWMVSRRDAEIWYTAGLGGLAVVSAGLIATTDYLTM